MLFLEAFNIWLIVQSLWLINFTGGFASAVQIFQGTVTFALSLIWMG